MSDTTMRDAVVREFTFTNDAGVHRVWRVAGMADEILRLRAENAALTAAVERAERILAALREPSENVSNAVWSTWGFWDSQNHFAATLHALVRAAVTAAEQEVGRE